MKVGREGYGKETTYDKANVKYKKNLEPSVKHFIR
jgi:hypothetical protein